MCSIDDADFICDVLSSRTPKARKAHRCDECFRTIQPGEQYLAEYLTGEDAPKHHKTCSHCQVARAWLHRECGGWLYGGVAEDMTDHWGRSLSVSRLIWGISRKWTRRNGALMPVPALPQEGA